MKKKYELIKDDTIKVYDKVLYRIRALKDFGDIKAGQLGGYIETEENLSHKGLCWISDNARVHGAAKVTGNAWVSGSVLVCGNAQIFSNAWVANSALVCGNSRVSGDTRVAGSARVFGDAHVFGDAQVYGDARVFGNAEVSGDALVSDNAHISGNASVSGDTLIVDNAQISGNAQVYGYAKIAKDANICKLSDYVTIGPIGSRGDYTTFYTSKTGKIMVSCGCFNNNIDEFIKGVNITHKDNEKYRKQYLDTVEYIKNIKLGGK